MKHTKEPWHESKLRALPYVVCNKRGVVIANCDVAEDYLTRIEAQANAERIVACVNACAGLPEPEKDIRRVIEVLSMEQVLEHANVCSVNNCTGRCIRFRGALAPFEELARKWLAPSVEKK